MCSESDTGEPGDDVGGKGQCIVWKQRGRHDEMRK